DSVALSLSQHLAQALFTLACLPYEALSNLDAVGRTSVRMLITRRRLLEWSPSADVNRNGVEDLAATCRSMWIGPLLAAALTIDLVISRPTVFGSAAPILCLWFASPAIAWWLSQPLARREPGLTAGQSMFLRKLSR